MITDRLSARSSGVPLPTACSVTGAPPTPLARAAVFGNSAATAWARALRSAALRPPSPAQSEYPTISYLTVDWRSRMPIHDERSWATVDERSSALPIGKSATTTESPAAESMPCPPARLTSASSTPAGDAARARSPRSYEGHTGSTVTSPISMPTARLPALRWSWRTAPGSRGRRVGCEPAADRAADRRGHRPVPYRRTRRRPASSVSLAQRRMQHWRRWPCPSAMGHRRISQD